MKWWLILFVVSCAVAIPQDNERPHHSRRVVKQRRVAVPPGAVPVHAGAWIPPPVKPTAGRVQAVRVAPTKSTATEPIWTVPVPAPYRTPSPAVTHSGAKTVTSANRFPAIQAYPGVRSLSREESEALQRQIQQWQIAVVGGQYPPPTGYPVPSPPGGPPSPAPPGGAYPGSVPAGPGTIWIQVPAGGYPPPTHPPPPAAPLPVENPHPAPGTEASEGPGFEGEAPAGEEIPAPVGGQFPAPVGGEIPAPAEGPVPSPAGGPVPAPVGGHVPETGGGEGVPAIPEAPVGGVAPTGVGATTGQEGVAPVAETPVTPGPPPPPVPTPVGGTAPGGVAPGGSVPDGHAPAVEIPGNPSPPATGGGTPVSGGGSPPAVGVGDEHENKLVHCKKPRGQFAHESSCSKFYNCWDDVVVEQSCPNGLAFSEEKSYCDYPENVNCKEMPMGGPSMPIEDHGGCSSPYGSYRSKTNCSEFFICVNGDPVKFACPSNLSYNDELRVCDYPYRVNCHNAPPAPEPLPPGAVAGAPSPAVVPPSAPAGPEPAVPAPPAPVAEHSGTPDAGRLLPPAFLKAGSPCWHNNVYPLDQACSRVSVCRSGTTSILACPKGMAFDVYKHRCLPYYRARC